MKLYIEITDERGRTRSLASNNLVEIVARIGRKIVARYNLTESGIAEDKTGDTLPR